MGHVGGNTTPYGLAVSELNEAISRVKVRNRTISDEDKALLIGKIRGVERAWKASSDNSAVSAA